MSERRVGWQWLKTWRKVAEAVSLRRKPTGLRNKGGGDVS
jgi:hypothetical protein